MDKDIERLMRGIFAAYRLGKKLHKRRATATKKAMEAPQEYWEPVSPLTLRIPRNRAEER